MILGLVVCILLLRVKGPYLSFGTLYEDKIYKYVHQTLMDTKCEQFYARVIL